MELWTLFHHGTLEGAPSTLHLFSERLKAPIFLSAFEQIVICVRWKEGQREGERKRVRGAEREREGGRVCVRRERGRARVRPPLPPIRQFVRRSSLLARERERERLSFGG